MFFHQPTLLILLILLLLLFLRLPSSALCAPVEAAWQAVTPLHQPLLGQPEPVDNFYSQSVGAAFAKPGTILAYRPVPNPITLDNRSPIKPKAAWQIKYRTQNSVGKPEETILTLLEPFNAVGDNLFMYHFFSNAAYVGCNPSFSLQTGTREDNSFTQIQTLTIVAALKRGWYVGVADDGGPQATFGSGLQWGYATLDAIRAAKQSGNFTGISTDPIVTLHGYSAGATSAGWATELQPDYAPEIRIDGAAIGGLSPNFTQLLLTLNGNERSRFLPATALGLAHDYANLTAWLKENLVPEHETEFRRAEHQCFDSNNAQFSNVNMGRFFKRGLRSFEQDAVPVSVRADTCVMGNRATPRTPWYLYQSVGDEASSIELTDRLYEKHCANGANIHYERSPVQLNHSMESLAGITGAFEWLEDVHQRKLVRKPGCQTVGVSDWSLRGATQMSFFSNILDDLLAWYGQPIGPSMTRDGQNNAPAWSSLVMLASLLAPK